MKLVELTLDEVIRFNYKAIADQKQKDPNNQERHNLIRRGDLESAIYSIFYQTTSGYINLPIERMAGLLRAYP